MNRRIVFSSLIGLLILIIIAATTFFMVGPAVIEEGRNKIVPATMPEVTAEAQELHDTLQIVDMHSDTLM
ncbi:hypothetical protein [Dietzia aerolata]|uniref:Peptidase M19 n=1 Tax=Dietzia aerolata TaxID=595984 RepID=A0ABV5JSZ1_9ACTN|nr:hypothetical protein [Dietzia aerolata]